MVNSLTIGNHSLSCFRFDVEYFGSKWAKFKLLHISGSIGLYSVNVWVPYKFIWAGLVLLNTRVILPFSCRIMKRSALGVPSICLILYIYICGVCSPKAWAIFFVKKMGTTSTKIRWWNHMFFWSTARSTGGFFHTATFFLTLQAASNSRSRRQGASIIFLHEKKKGLEW